jgi:serine/threonine-protein kinase
MNQPNLRLVEDDLAPQAPPPDPLIGKVLDGRYLVEKVLGEGGMGIVYRAKHTALGKSLAVKVLRAEVSKDQEIVARFRQEARSATEIGNEHIIDISDFGALPDGSTYFVMEFLDGIALTKAMENDRPVPAARTIRIAKQICTALGAAHEAGIVHRDLKPDNIYLVKRSEDKDFVKVLDFGIAKVGGATSKLTRAGQVFGTPHYMSPEQCAGTNVDQRTDIYALGVILYEMACGRVPFDADNLMGILTKHLYENPIPPRELPPPTDVPAGLESVILKALSKKPETRYQTMAEVRADLERLEQGVTPQAVMDAVDRASGGGAMGAREGTQRTGLAMGVGEPDGYAEKKKSSMLPIALGGVFVLLLVVGGIGAFVMSGAGETPRPPTVATAPVPIPLVPVPVVPPVPANPVAPVGTPPPVAAVKVTITSEPAGASVYRDDALLGNTPFEVDRPVGEATFELSLRSPGFVDQPVRLSSMTQATVRIPLERERRGGGGGVRRPPGGGQAGATPPIVHNTRPAGGSGSEVINPWDQ